MRVVGGNKHRFGSLEVDGVDRYYLNAKTHKRGMVSLPWPGQESPAKVVAFL